MVTGKSHRKLLALNATFIEKDIEERCVTFLSSINKRVTDLEENNQAQITQITSNQIYARVQLMEPQSIPVILYQQKSNFNKPTERLAVMSKQLNYL